MIKTFPETVPSIRRGIGKLRIDGDLALSFFVDGKCYFLANGIPVDAVIENVSWSAVWHEIIFRFRTAEWEGEREITPLCRSL